MSIEFHELDFRQPNVQATEAAALIVRAVYHDYGKGNYTDAADYIESADPEIDNYYALTDSDMGLLAATSVIHMIEGKTWVNDIAVRPTERQKGYGSVLLRGVAARAIDYGDSRLRLHPLNPRAFRAMGFSYCDCDANPHMEIGIDEFLTQSSSRLDQA